MIRFMKEHHRKSIELKDHVQDPNKIKAEVKSKNELSPGYMIGVKEIRDVENANFLDSLKNTAYYKMKMQQKKQILKELREEENEKLEEIAEEIDKQRD
jgi:CHASE3 domain sensor protein